VNSDESFKYVFKPNYSVIELTDSSFFQGIPGLNIDLKEEEYVRENKVPTFISERVPSSNREDFYELLSKLRMDYMDPIEYLVRTKEQYSGDKLFVLPYKEKEVVVLENIHSHETNTAIIRKALEVICFGDDLVLSGQTIDDSNRKAFHDVFIGLYSRSFELNKELQREGIEKAKGKGKYKGRKPIEVDTMKFWDYLSRVDKKEISSSQAAKELGLSIDKYYRLKKQLQK